VVDVMYDGFLVKIRESGFSDESVNTFGVSRPFNFTVEYPSLFGVGVKM